MILQRIQSLLEQVDFTCSLLPTSEASHEKLLLFSGLDSQKREKNLEMTAYEQQFDASVSKIPQNDRYYRIQFYSLLPFEVEPLALNQTASLILFLNQLMDWPGFELNELTNRVSYRYMWLTKESAMDPHLLMTLVGSFLLSLDMFSDTIEQIASGRSTFNELLESIAQFGQQVREDAALPKPEIK